MGDGFAREEEWAAGIGLEDGVPLGDSELVKWCGLVRAGVVDQNVEPAVASHGGGHGALDGGLGADIALDCEAAAAKLLNGVNGFDGVIRRGPVGDGDVSSGSGQGERDGASDAPGASGH